MKLRSTRWVLGLMVMSILLSSCNFLLGSKEDESIDEIFEQGAIDPELNPQNVGYVPVQPYWTGFSNPKDVFVGYDEMIYVVDDNGLNVMDATGTIQRTIFIPGATEVCQDRRLHTYVIGKVEVDLCNDGSIEEVAAVYRLSGTALASGVQFLDTLIHPLNDISRNSSCFRGADDLAVEFTGLTCLADNRIYVSRKGPRNSLTSITRPDNTILIFDEDGNNTGYSIGLNPVSSSLKSCLDVGGIAGFAGPPQSLSGISTSKDFLLIQKRAGAQYKALWIKEFEDPETGTYYGENAALTLQDPSKADRFLYEPDRFLSPSDVYVAPDFTSYIFVTDDVSDSLYIFSPQGYEGVNAPATSTDKTQIIASFGGPGTGPFNFNEPSGVCYHRKIIYVADKGNHRIARYTLSTDIE